MSVWRTVWALLYGSLQKVHRTAPLCWGRCSSPHLPRGVTQGHKRGPGWVHGVGPSQPSRPGTRSVGPVPGDTWGLHRPKGKPAGPTPGILAGDFVKDTRSCPGGGARTMLSRWTLLGRARTFQGLQMAPLCCPPPPAASTAAVSTHGLTAVVSHTMCFPVPCSFLTHQRDSTGGNGT